MALVLFILFGSGSLKFPRTFWCTHTAYEQPGVGIVAPNIHLFHYLWKYPCRFTSFLFPAAFSGTQWGRKTRATCIEIQVHSICSSNMFFINLFVHSIDCLTCPHTVPQQVLQTVQSSASSFNFQYPFVSLR